MGQVTKQASRYSTELGDQKAAPALTGFVDHPASVPAIFLMPDRTMTSNAATESVSPLDNVTSSLPAAFTVSDKTIAANSGPLPSTPNPKLVSAAPQSLVQPPLNDSKNGC